MVCSLTRKLQFYNLCVFSLYFAVDSVSLSPSFLVAVKEFAKLIHNLLLFTVQINE